MTFKHAQWHAVFLSHQKPFLWNLEESRSVDSSLSALHRCVYLLCSISDKTMNSNASTMRARNIVSQIASTETRLPDPLIQFPTCQNELCAQQDGDESGRCGDPIYTWTAVVLRLPMMPIISGCGGA